MNLSEFKKKVEARFKVGASPCSYGEVRELIAYAERTEKADREIMDSAKVPMPSVAKPLPITEPVKAPEPEITTSNRVTLGSPSVTSESLKGKSEEEYAKDLTNDACARKEAQRVFGVKPEKKLVEIVEKSEAVHDFVQEYDNSGPKTPEKKPSRRRGKRD